MNLTVHVRFCRQVGQATVRLSLTQRLPDLDGTELLEQVRQAPDTVLRQLPAIAVTSYSREYSAAAALKAGFDYFLTKPIEPEPLVEAILQLVA